MDRDFVVAIERGSSFSLPSPSSLRENFKPFRHYGANFCKVHEERIELTRRLIIARLQIAGKANRQRRNRNGWIFIRVQRRGSLSVWSRNICIHDVRSPLLEQRYDVCNAGRSSCELNGRSSSWISNTTARRCRLNGCTERRIYMQRGGGGGATCCYRYSKSPFSTQGVRCVDDKCRYSVNEASAFVEPAPPSCGYLHISISSAQHTEGVPERSTCGWNTWTRVPAHHRAPPFYLAPNTCACFIVCLCARRRWMCREDPMEKIPLSWTTITTPGYRERKYTHLEAELF